MKNVSISIIILAPIFAACATTATPRTATESTVATISSPSSPQVSKAKIDEKPEPSAVEPQAASGEPDEVRDLAEKSPEILNENGVQPDDGSITSASAIEPEPELTEIQKLAKSGDFAGARALAFNDYKTGKSENLSEFWMYYEADPLMTETLDETVRPHGTNALSALGGGSTVSFKYTDSADDSAKAAIKPDQDLRQTMYRSEIAYYRLCQVLGCSFDTPVTRPVRWTKADFNALYNASDSKKNRGYLSTRAEHLIWANEDGKKYLYAAYKEWIPDFTGFPIEVSSAWALYLRPGTTNYPDLKTLLRNMLNGSRPGSINYLSKYLDYAQNLTTRDILQQLSDITLVDYLTNNWDRYAGTQDNYGANCHFQRGGIIAIDNGAAFPAWHAPRVVKRLHAIQTFSRDLVNKLRTLDPDTLFDHLFPNPTKEEQRSRDRFKERRTEALKYIGDLIKKHGEDKILVF